MNEQLRFLQMVEELARKGKENNNYLLRAQVESYLKEHGSSTDYLEAICDFLFTKQVLVEGYIPKREAQPEQLRALLPEEEAFKADYEEELSMLPTFSEGEIFALCKQAITDENAATELATALLPRAFQIALSHAGKKVLLGDLVQEGSLMVVVFCSELHGMTEYQDKTGAEILAMLENKINLALEALLAEEKDSNLEARKVVAKLNQLVEAVEALKEQQAEYTIEDLAEFLAMDVEEIENLLRIAGELEEE